MRPAETRNLPWAALSLACLAAALAPTACRHRPGEGAAPHAGDESVLSALPPTGTLTLLTYNVLADPVEVERRIPPLMSLLAGSNADIIVLQEVAPWFLDLLSRQPWVETYHFSQIDGQTTAPGGQLILSRFPIVESWYRVLPGPQGRTVLLSKLSIDGRTAVVATTHLDSPLESGAVRAEQLDAIFPLLAGADDAFLLGDFNFGDGEEPETSHLPPDFTDLWLALRSGEHGFTWDIESSEMARLSSFPGEPSRRLDRILVRSSAWVPADVRILGDGPVLPGSRDLFPSDHFGLVGIARPSSP